MLHTIFVGVHRPLLKVAAAADLLLLRPPQLQGLFQGLTTAATPPLGRSLLLELFRDRLKSDGLVARSVVGPIQSRSASERVRARVETD